MDFPEDQNKLRDYLLTDPEIAYKWYHISVRGYSHRRFHLNRRLLPPSLQEKVEWEDADSIIFYEWLKKILPQYVHEKTTNASGNLAGWSCYCIKKMLYTYFGAGRARKQWYLKFASLDGIMEMALEDGKGEIGLIEIQKQRDIDYSIEIFNHLQKHFFRKLSPKEKRFWTEFVAMHVNPNDRYKSRGVTIPLEEIAERLNCPSKDVDNGFYRIRMKLKKYINKTMKIENDEELALNKAMKKLLGPKGER